eukprot:4051754-Heterocapsa_arctica.AAC.1
MKDGVDPHFDNPACLVRRAQRLPLLMAGPLYYLPVYVTKVAGQRLRDDNYCVISVRHRNAVMFYEYCCSDDSWCEALFAMGQKVT